MREQSLHDFNQQALRDLLRYRQQVHGTLAEINITARQVLRRARVTLSLAEIAVEQAMSPCIGPPEKSGAGRRMFR